MSHKTHFEIKVNMTSDYGTKTRLSTGSGWVEYFTVINFYRFRNYLEWEGPDYANFITLLCRHVWKAKEFVKRVTLVLWN